jgi:glycosyltransferase involved in cell wall biosynthesis
MKMSIITASYNSAATLGRTLRSIEMQDHSDIEYIVIDGGSTDDTAALVRAAGPRVSHFISEPDRGIYDAMNKGLARASGEVIGFLNADDHYAHDRVLARVAGLFAASALDAVLGDVAFFEPQAPDRIVRRYRSDRFSPAALAWGWMPAHPSLFVRRSVFERIGFFKTNYQIAGDYEWVARAFTRSPMRYQHVAEVLVHMQTGGVSTRGWRNTLLLNQEVLRACRENGIDTNWFKILSKYPAKFLEYARS